MKKPANLFKRAAAAVIAASIVAAAPTVVSADWEVTDQGWSWTVDGQKTTGWQWIDSKWYYMDDSGTMKTGWIQDGAFWYYMAPSGEMKTGWINDNGTWYYTQPNGMMKTGWVNDNGAWYYMDGSGAMRTGWVNDNDTWYCMDGNGAMCTGWAMSNNKWYYLDPTGAMVTSSVIKINDKVYSVAADGTMETGEVTIEGKTYTFDKDGAAVGDNIPEPSRTFTNAGGVDKETTPTAPPAGDNTDSGSTEPTKPNRPGSSSDGSNSGNSGSSGGGSGDSGNSGSGGGDSGSSGSNPGGDGKPEKPEEKPEEPSTLNLYVRNPGGIGETCKTGTWMDTEKGIQLIANESTYFWGEIGINGEYDKDRVEYEDYILMGNWKVNQIVIRYFEKQTISNAITNNFTGSRPYINFINEQGDKKKLYASTVTWNDETGIVTLTFCDGDDSLCIRFEISENRKRITLLDVHPDQIVMRNNIPCVFYMSILPDTTAAVTTEQEVREALANPKITRLTGNTTYFTKPLIIDRDIEFDVLVVAGAEKWEGNGGALVTITNGAHVKITDRRFEVWNDAKVDTVLAVKSATLEGNGFVVRTSNRNENVICGIYAENAKINIAAKELIKGDPNAYLISDSYGKLEVGIKVDTAENSKSEIIITNEAVDSEGTLVIAGAQQIISGSADTVVSLPSSYVEFTNDEGHREWTNNPDKIEQLPKE